MLEMSHKFYLPGANEEPLDSYLVHTNLNLHKNEILQQILNILLQSKVVRCCVMKGVV